MSLPPFSNSCDGNCEILAGSSKARRVATEDAGTSVLDGSVVVSVLGKFSSDDVVNVRNISPAYCTDVLITSQTAEKKETSRDSSSSARDASSAAKFASSVVNVSASVVV